jgi:hypothetical protein
MESRKEETDGKTPLKAEKKDEGKNGDKQNIVLNKK